MRLSTIGHEAEMLLALLTMCTGEGFDQFSSMAEHLQHAALTAATDLASKINRIADGVEHV
ncbi:hypothetical protein, partial [Paraburkholderia phytofirmans]